MSHTPRRFDSKVFDAASAPLRLQILRRLNVQGPLSYSEIMNQLDLNPSRDAGKFAYHLRNVLKPGLVDVDREAKKYRLTPLGRMVVAFSQRLEEYAVRERGRLLVRTSRIAMEEFDRSKIVQSLILEAGVPADLAQKIAEETEERLLRLDTLYLTAPLIREFVNAILIEKGLHEYRHRLTRLGLPVYDVTQLIRSAEEASLNVNTVHSLAGDRVMKEYVLLNILPREVADAHLSGKLHLNNIGSWVLRPDEFQHDLRFFLHRGLRTGLTGFTATSLNPPKTLHAALSLASAVLKASSTELTGEQALNPFNVLIAPFVRGLSMDEVREALRLFIFTLNQPPMRGVLPADVALILEFVIPDHLETTEAFGAGGEKVGEYGNYDDEAKKVLDTLLELMFEDDDHRPIINPHPVLNLREEALSKGEAEPLLLKAHQLAARCGTPYFVNLAQEWQDEASYLSTGTRLAPDWTGDWELDTVRTGSLGSVIVNLPRLVYEARGSETRLLGSLERCLETAGKALKIKRNIIEGRVRRSLLPFLSQQVNGEPYSRLKNATSLISLVGLNEATRAYTGYRIHDAGKATAFATKLVEQMAALVRRLSGELSLRLALSQTPGDEAAQRLAELDAKRYGWAVVHAQGTKEAPYYTDLVALPLEAEFPLRDRLKIEGRFHTISTGGHLAIVELEEPEQKPEYLMRMTREICRSYSIGAFTFTRGISYCPNCREAFGGLLQKCPGCGSADSVLRLSRSSAKYLPLRYWVSSKQRAVDGRFRYLLS